MAIIGGGCFPRGGAARGSGRRQTQPGTRARTCSFRAHSAQYHSASPSTEARQVHQSILRGRRVWLYRPGICKHGKVITILFRAFRHSHELWTPPLHTASTGTGKQSLRLLGSKPGGSRTPDEGPALQSVRTCTMQQGLGACTECKRWRLRSLFFFPSPSSLSEKARSPGVATPLCGSFRSTTLTVSSIWTGTMRLTLCRKHVLRFGGAENAMPR